MLSKIDIFGGKTAVYFHKKFDTKKIVSFKLGNSVLKFERLRIRDFWSRTDNFKILEDNGLYFQEESAFFFTFYRFSSFSLA
jgi:hypothetical protein